MKERFLNGYNDFVLPFMFGMIFILAYLIIGAIRVIIQLPPADRKRFLLSLISPRILFKDLKDIICDVLLHVKIFKRNAVLGYMHASIAFGWFMLIVLGHIETWLYTPARTGLFYYPIFFRFFVLETNHTLRGALLFFLMDFFLLVVLSGITLAIIKRVRSRWLGMRRTTKQSLPDKIAMYCLWAIFPLRFLAEGFTAGISGGSFFTEPTYWLFSNFLSNDYHILPTWWAYSCVLGLFFFLLPFSRYMHIPTEAFLIMLRNAGVKAHHPKKGYATAEIYSCSSCGLCIDACPMGVHKINLKYSSVYFIRFLRRGNKKKYSTIGDKCLMCGKCVAICPVGVDSCALKLANRSLELYPVKQNYDYLPDIKVEAAKEKVLYYGGCMTHLTPAISKSLTTILKRGGIEYEFMDEEGGICCGRPLLLSGKVEEAEALIQKNKRIIEESGATTLLLSCPICLKVFKENYNLHGLKIVHHSEFLDYMIKEEKISVEKGEEKLVFHDPCELGRGCGVYDSPRAVLNHAGTLVSAEKEFEESICCGGSLGSMTLSYKERVPITDLAIKNLTINNPDRIVTACPLCLKTFSSRADIPVQDISQVVLNKMKE